MGSRMSRLDQKKIIVDMTIIPNDFKMSPPRLIMATLIPAGAFSSS